LRFECRVTDFFSHSLVTYDGQRGQILLEHAYPKTAASIPQIWVDVNLMLSTASNSIFTTGSWVNVIGYTQQAGLKSTRHTSTQLAQNSGYQLSSLQAILVWDAGAIKLDDYEAIVREHQLTQAPR
jgi:hypothetical protein